MQDLANQLVKAREPLQFLSQMDEIRIKNLKITATVGDSQWNLEKPQVLVLNLTLFTAMGNSDLILDTVSYSTASKQVYNLVNGNSFKSLYAIAVEVCNELMKFKVQGLMVKIEKPKALLHAKAVGIEMLHANVPSYYHKGTLIYIKDMFLDCIIGVNDCERLTRQKVILNLELYPKLIEKFNCNQISNIVLDFVSKSTYKTVEAMAIDLSELVLKYCNKCTLSIEKPSALMMADTAGVQITRSLAFENKGLHKVYIGVGTNTGDRISNIHSALKLVERFSKLVDSSFLYESEPKYVVNQPKFLNCIVVIETALQPLELLKELKEIERVMGRDFGVEKNGPRVIDLDIVMYSHGLTHDCSRLSVPHLRMQERMFVLLPLYEYFVLTSVCDEFHPKLGKCVGEMLQDLKAKTTDGDGCVRVFRVGSQLWDFNIRAYMMGILNTTPDSFSDGGPNLDTETAVENGKKMLEFCDIIDVGGQSTRPNAPEVCEEEEIKRVVNVVERLKKLPGCLVSVDTFRARVAEECLLRGADLVNDVSGGTRDPLMLKLMARKQCSVCLMHSRGDSATMMNLTDYGPDFISTLTTEIKQMVSQALDAGIYRWNILLDPGIGFAKTNAQNYEILKTHLPSLSEIPWLVGASRKSFIGTTTSKPPTQREFGTAAAVTAAVLRGSAVVRVHDCESMSDVLKVAVECRTKFNT